MHKCPTAVPSSSDVSDNIAVFFIIDDLVGVRTSCSGWNLYAGSDSSTVSCQLDILFQLPSKPLPYVAIAEVLQSHAPSEATPTLGTGAVSVWSRHSGPTSPLVQRHQGSLLAFGLQEARSVEIRTSCRKLIYRRTRTRRCGTRVLPARLCWQNA